MSRHHAPPINNLPHICSTPYLCPMLIRPIEAKDNEALASIIREALTEFGANKPGTVYYDATTDALYDLFQTTGSFYYVAEENGILLGGGGIFPTEGLPTGTCELVKMYLHKTARGKGIGRQLIQQCLDWAKANGYEQAYLETMPELHLALKAYEQFGFTYLEGPLGNSGHFGCDRWMIKHI
ncbi:MAG: GNAT family N-acetyltransferase [Chitinophagaceae bacterium]